MMNIALLAFAASISAATTVIPTTAAKELCSATFPNFPGFMNIGFCTSTARCGKVSGTSLKGFCSGGPDNQCCVTGFPVADSGVSEVCMIDTPEEFGVGVCASTQKCKTAGGFSTKGFCPGTAADIQCSRSKTSFKN